MFAYCGNNPVNCYDSTGNSWKSVWDRFKSAVRTVLHNVNTKLISIGIDTAAVGAIFLCMSKDANGIYHASFDGWQQYFGYNDMYDFMFDIGTSMRSKKFRFVYNEEQYILWAWKGDYINMGAGAELGIYYGGDPHWRVDKNLSMKMSMTLKYNGKTIISYSATTWWLTGFNPAYTNVCASSLTATFTVYFNSAGMYNAFWEKHLHTWKFNSGSLSATYTF